MESNYGLEPVDLKEKEVFGGVDPSVPNWDEIKVDVDLRGSLSDSLRNKIGALSAVKPEVGLSQHINSFVDSVLNAPALDKTVLTPALNTLYEQQTLVYEEADIPKSLRTRQYVCGSGLIMSPDHCTTTIRDSLRVGLFLRGVDRAIKELQDKFSEPLHIVYPACGPFAPLLLPLLAYYKNRAVYAPGQLKVTFVDIQEGAVVALDALVKKLALSEYVHNIVCGDACEYKPDGDVHLVVLEAMQHGFSREGHLCLAKYYANLLHDDGIFLPKQIKVSASLNVAQREYVDQWKVDDAATRETIRGERTTMGTILNVDLEFLRSMNETVVDEHTRLVECATLAIPEVKNKADEQMLLIHTQVNVFGDDWLGEYESGITHPLPDNQVCVNFTPKDVRPGDLLVNSGDSLTFYYCMNGLPGFLTTKAADSVELGQDGFAEGNSNA